MKIPVTKLMTIPAVMMIMSRMKVEELMIIPAPPMLVTCTKLTMALEATQNMIMSHTLHKKVYGPTYVPYSEDGQKILLPQTTDMSRKENLKLLYNSHPKGLCDDEHESLEQSHIDSETFHYMHETSTKHVLVQGVYVGTASPLIADIKTDPYSVITYTDDSMLTGTYDNTHDIPILCR